MTEVPELSDRPLIFISGCGRDETIARALETGAADYIVKPFSPIELTARVRIAAITASAPTRTLHGALPDSPRSRDTLIRTGPGGDPN